MDNSIFSLGALTWVSGGIGYMIGVFSTVLIYAFKKEKTQYKNKKSHEASRDHSNMGTYR
jgi:uncharacterized membrane-anchored protein YhcB (DUF1043 family)